MSNEPKLQIVIIDDGGWVGKTLEYEITNRNSHADVVKTLKCDPLCPLKDIFDQIPPGNPERNENGEVIEKTIVWLPFTSDGCSSRHLLDEFYTIRDNYPHLAVHFAYENMARAYLHELARKYGVVPIDNILTEDGKSIPKPKKEEEPKTVAVGDNPDGKETVAVDPKDKKGKK